MPGVRGVMSGYREAITRVECYMTWESRGDLAVTGRITEHVVLKSNR